MSSGAQNMCVLLCVHALLLLCPYCSCALPSVHREVPCVNKSSCTSSFQDCMPNSHHRELGHDSDASRTLAGCSIAKIGLFVTTGASVKHTHIFFKCFRICLSSRLLESRSIARCCHLFTRLKECHLVPSSQGPIAAIVKLEAEEYEIGIRLHTALILLA